jgi:hypothetical protein
MPSTLRVIRVGSMQSEGFNTSNEQWLMLMGTSDGRPMVFCRNESAKQLIGFPELSFCTRVTISFTTIDSQGIANSEGPSLDMVQFKLRELLQSRGACHALTVTTNGHREWVFYTSQLWSLEEIIGALDQSIDIGRLSFHCGPDEQWSTFREYA